MKFHCIQIILTEKNKSTITVIINFKLVSNNLFFKRECWIHVTVNPDEVNTNTILIVEYHKCSGIIFLKG